jgi:hypothetical protein
VQIILNVFRRSHWSTCCPPPGLKASESSRESRWASGLCPGNTPRTPGSPPTIIATATGTGEAFDVGETFIGVPYDVGIAAAREVTTHAPAAVTTAQLALRWVIDQPGVTTVIPGARKPNRRAPTPLSPPSTLAPPEVHEALATLYDSRIRQYVQSHW